MVKGAVYRIYCLGFRVKRLGFRGLEFEIGGLGLRFLDLRFRV